MPTISSKGLAHDAWRCALVAAAAIIPTARTSGAQLPGLPVLQGAFPAPGFAGAVNVGRDDGRTLGAAALGYGQGSGRLGAVAGLGVRSAAEPGYSGSRLAYGTRVAFTALRLLDQRVAVTPFAGFGSARGTVADAAVARGSITTADVGKTISRDEIPLGIAAGWRFAVGETRALALTVAPMYALSRQTGGTANASEWYARVALVAEGVLSRRLGVTLGAELGQNADDASPGPRGGRIGAGVSLRFGR